MRTAPSIQNPQRRLAVQTALMVRTADPTGNKSKSPTKGLAKKKLEGTIEKAEESAKGGVEIVPGLFKYQEPPNIPGYAQHHLWPQAMGGPKEGWIIYAKQQHATLGGIQGRLNTHLRQKLNVPQRQLELWARENPDQILPFLRDFYKTEGIPLPY